VKGSLIGRGKPEGKTKLSQKEPKTLKDKKSKAEEA
jgi:hypothetical protein